MNGVPSFKSSQDPKTETPKIDSHRSTRTSSIKPSAIKKPEQNSAKIERPLAQPSKSVEKPPSKNRYYSTKLVWL